MQDEYLFLSGFLCYHLIITNNQHVDAEKYIFQTNFQTIQDSFTGQTDVPVLNRDQFLNNDRGIP